MPNYKFTKDFLDFRKGSLCDQKVLDLLPGFSRPIVALLLHLGIIEEVKEGKWEPGKREDYYYIYGDGKIYHDKWVNDNIDRTRRDFLSIYRTHKEAEAVASKVREFVKGLGE